MHDELEIWQLRKEIVRLLAVTHQQDAELDRRDDLYVAETSRREQLHICEVGLRDQSHIDEMALLARAIESRDTIGQAKGVLIVIMGCTADGAFQLLKNQSQHENRKLVEVATEIVERAQRKRRPA